MIVTPMMSFLFVDTERVWRGGQDQLLSLLGGLTERRHRVHLVCHPQTLLERRASKLGIRVHPLNIRSEVDPVSFLRLIRILLQVQPQIIAFNTPRPILAGNLASRLSKTRVRIVFRRVNFPLRKNLITRIKYTWGIDCIVAISESINQQLQVSRIPADKIRTVYEGMDLDPYPKRQPASSPPTGRPFVVGTVAHLSSEKGLQYLIEAAALIPDVISRIRFVIVGDGACRQELENQVRERGLEECFQFTGFQNKINAYLNTFDLFVLPSLSEGLSSAILNAMASSLPVVATEVGGIPELVIHGQNGLLVPPSNAAALSQAIRRLIENPGEAQRMGMVGRMRMEEKFTLQRKISETEELCASFLNRSTPISHAASSPRGSG